MLISTMSTVSEPLAYTDSAHHEIVAEDNTFLASLLEYLQKVVFAWQRVPQRVMIQNDISTVNDNHDKCCIP